MERQRAVQKTEAKQQESPCSGPTGRGRASDHPVLHLQRAIGNQSVQRLLNPGSLQTKLKVGAPGDMYEQEADRVAEHVMRMPSPALRRTCAPCAAGGTLCPECKEEEESLVQRKTEAPSKAADVSVPDKFLGSLGPGQPLDPTTRALFEPRFRHDFGQVRVHTGAGAAESARAVGALAYTVGNDTVFSEGQFEPRTAVGLRIIAHELAHVVQQGGGKPSGRDSPSIQRQTDPKPPTEKCDDLARPIDDSEDVYMCTRPVGGAKGNPFHHAFYRIGSNKTGCGPTYSLFPDEEAPSCIRGIPEKDAEVDDDAECVRLPISWSCVHRQASKYPWGRYCLPGPNSNTFVRVIRDACGDTTTKPPSGFHPGWNYDKPDAGKGTMRNLFGDIYSYYDCEEVDCGPPTFGLK